MITIETLPLGPLETNCYLLRQASTCWVVDPGMFPGPLLDRLAELKVRVQRILLTHGHGDHIAGADEVKGAFPGCQIVCPADDAFMLGDPQANLSGMLGLPLTCGPADRLVRPGDSLDMDGWAWTVLETSGHTPGGVSYYCQAAGAVLTGDALFADSIGRTDFPGASAGRLLRNIAAHLMTLPPATRVLPGHGPETTIGQERMCNPFLSEMHIRGEE